MPTLIKSMFGVISVLMLVAMIVALVLGRHFGVRQRARREGMTGEGTAAVEGALFALFGLMVALSFSGAEDRLDDRRKLIVAEANAIGTAYLRVDLLPPPTQPAIRQHFRQYLDARIAYYQKLLDFDAARVERARAEELQEEIWKDAVTATARAPDDLRGALLVIPSLNEMIDISMSREAVFRMHIPLSIFALLGLLSISCAFMAGVGMSRSQRASWLHIISFAGTLALTTYVILNLEFPRIGFARLDRLDVLLAHVRAGMN